MLVLLMTLGYHGMGLRAFTHGFAPQASQRTATVIATGLTVPPELAEAPWLPELQALLGRNGSELDARAPALAVSSRWADAAAARADGEGACHGRGHFDQMAGRCFCRAGYEGDACEAATDQFKCNDDRKTCRGGAFQPGQATSGSVGHAPSCM